MEQPRYPRIQSEPDMPAETRGACVSYYGKVSGVPLTYTLMRDNEVVRFLSSKHGVPTATSGGRASRDGTRTSASIRRSTCHP